MSAEALNLRSELDDLLERFRGDTGVVEAEVNPILLAEIRQALEEEFPRKWLERLLQRGGVVIFN